MPRRLAILFLVSSSLATPAVAGAGNCGLSTDFTIIAIGDTGVRNQNLYRNAMAIDAEVRCIKARQDEARTALFFLGDNFYPNGLALENHPLRSFRQLYGWLRPAARTLKAGASTDPENLKKPLFGVHAVPGNHDYYYAAAAPGLLGKVAPLGFSIEGNKAEEEKGKEYLGWQYHHQEPQEALWSFEKREGGKKGIQVIFLDSTLLVRGEDWEHWKELRGKCKENPDAPTRLLQCFFRTKIRDRLTSLLKASAVAHGADGVWRILVAHHPLDTAGSHGGAQWIEPEKDVVRIPVAPCDRALKPLDYLKNQLDPEDLCASADYRELVREAITASGAKVHLALAGHDHSLQLLKLDKGGCLMCPDVQIVSGAGAKRSEVDAPSASESRYTAYGGEREQGKSKSGWAKLRFTPQQILVQFFSGKRDITGDMTKSQGYTPLPVIVINEHGMIPERVKETVR